MHLHAIVKRWLSVLEKNRRTDERTKEPFVCGPAALMAIGYIKRLVDLV
jgi:hypothetical protein